MTGFLCWKCFYKCLYHGCFQIFLSHMSCISGRGCQSQELIRIHILHGCREQFTWEICMH